MVTATAKTKPSETTRQLIENSEALFDTAESILRSCESPTDVPDPSDLAILRLYGIDVDNPQELSREISRALRVGRLKQDAGTNSEYAQARTACDAAQQREASRRPELESQIVELQRQLEELAVATKAGEQCVGGMASAREQLRDDTVLPKYVRDRLNRARKHTAAGAGGRIATLEGRLVSIAGIVKLDRNTREAMTYANYHLRDSLQRGVGGGNIVIDGAAWALHVGELNAERARIEKELAPLRQQLEADLAEADQLRNFYIYQI